MSLVFAGLVIFFTVFFVYSQIKKDISVVDIAWGLGFFLVWCISTIQSGQWGTKTLISGLLIFIWALRLSLYIYLRNKKVGEDYRYKELSANWKGNLALNAYVRVYLFQALLLFLLSAPIYYIAHSNKQDLTFIDFIAIAVWLSGFLVESIADYQKDQFKKDPLNKGKICQTGLAKYSRYPNYFGESLLWWGIYMFTLSTESPVYALALSPALLTFFLLKVSGVPFIEKRRKLNPEYQDYVKRTNLFIPWFPRK